MSIEWAAGLFEGEGSIGARKGRYEDSPRMLRLQLASTDEDVLLRFREVVGGNVRGPYGPYRANKKKYWSWTADGDKGKAILNILLPYLGERRTAKAEEVMALVRLYRS